MCVCVYVCTCAVNTSRTVKVSSFSLWWPFDGMRESGGEGGAVYISPVLYNTRSKVDPMETDIPVAEQRAIKNPIVQKVALCCLHRRHAVYLFIFISMLD